MLRRCRRCCVEKSLSDFDENPEGSDPDGYRKWCRACCQTPTTYRVYVIELSDSAGPRKDPRLPNVYVGQTAANVDCRYWQHRNGVHSASIVKRHGIRLRPDLYDDLPILETQGEALQLEQETADRLDSGGYKVHQN